jgi:hypothetical protein
MLQNRDEANATFKLTALYRRWQLLVGNAISILLVGHEGLHLI